MPLRLLKRWIALQFFPETNKQSDTHLEGGDNMLRAVASGLVSQQGKHGPGEALTGP